jgi:UDP-2-acetamido-2,6-beta-L-arabino-hexul-4-ose reductase
MVVGNGMIANRFMDYKDDDSIIIFASGVSNSKDTIEQNFLREFALLDKTIKSNADKVLVYFSTCSIEDEDLQSAPYVIHKKAIEKFIEENAPNYFIFRVSNLAGTSNNPYTLLNYFIFNVLQNHPLTVWKNAYRNIIGIDDMYSITNYILQKNLFPNTTINIANPENYSVPFIINTIETYLDKKAVSFEEDKGDNYNIDVSEIEPIIRHLNIPFNDEYLASLLKKYYHSR